MIMVAIFKLTNNISDFQDIIDVTFARDDGAIFKPMSKIIDSLIIIDVTHATFKLNKVNFVNIKISLTLILQMMMVALFKLTDSISDFQKYIDDTVASDDGCHIQAHR